MNPTDELALRLSRRWGPDRVFRPGDDVFASASAPWNAAATARPAVVVRPRSSGEVATAVVAARDTGVELSVRGGGHDWTGRALRDGGIVLDLAELRDVRIVPAEGGTSAAGGVPAGGVPAGGGVTGGVAVVGGGSRSGDVVAAAARHGLLVAAGTAGGVGMAGLTLGGGYGPLLGTAGLAADNLLGADVVLADGRRVSTEDDPELLWALRGGGGNVGVVTRMRVRLHRDRGLIGGTVLFPWADAAGVLSRYAELVSDAPDGLTLLVELTVVAALGPCLLVQPAWSGDPRDAGAALDRVRHLGTPVRARIGPAPLTWFDRNVPIGMHWDVRTRRIAVPTPEIVDVVAAAAESRPGPGAVIGLRQFHGTATRVGADDTAFGLRSPHVAVEITAGRGWHEDPGPYRAWADRVSAALAPHSLPGGHPDLLAAGDHEQIAHAYGAHAARLVAAKEHYDPAHVFTSTPLPERREPQHRGSQR